MNQTTRLQQAPESTDLEGWRQAIEQGLMPKFRLEEIAAAFQDLGPRADLHVRNSLARHLSDAMIHLLRRLVGLNHPNHGADIIYRVHGQLFEALLIPKSADGTGLREAFTARVSFRIKDALATECRHSRIPVAGENHTPVEEQKTDEAEQIVAGQKHADNTADVDPDDENQPQCLTPDLALLDGVRDFDQQIDVNRFLSAVLDERKRLAFYLHMDGVPYGSTRGESIARALGVSKKTAKEWVKEVQQILKSNVEIQELRKATLGGRI